MPYVQVLYPSARSRNLARLESLRLVLIALAGIAVVVAAELAFAPSETETTAIEVLSNS